MAHPFADSREGLTREQALSLFHHLQDKGFTSRVDQATYGLDGGGTWRVSFNLDAQPAVDDWWTERAGRDENG